MRPKNCFIYDTVTSVDIVNTFGISHMNVDGALVEEGHAQYKGRIIN